ncbi:MAG: ribokinase [Baekduia sp.]|nr:ribokinase [Baekduia sp.]
MSTQDPMTGTETARRPRVLVVGSSMIDLVAYADPLPEAGETVMGSLFQQGFGGKGANQAVTARRLGADVGFVGRVGQDTFGPMTIDNLQAEGIDASTVKALAGQSTGVAPIWVQADGTNRIIVVPGANQALTAADVRSELGGLPAAAVVVCQLEIAEEAVAEALRIGRSWGAVTILNPAPARASAIELFPLADWVVPNETEFALLWGAEATEDEVRRAAREWGCGLIVTLGERGAIALVDGAIVRREPPVVDVVDTTGAGDAFVGGLSFALASGLDVGAALELGNLCGALSATARGTQTSFPTREAVEAHRRSIA